MGQGVQRIGIHQIALADENLVRKPDLAARLLAVVQLLGGVLGVHQGDDGIQQIAFGHLVVHEEGLRHRSWVGNTGGLDDHALKIQQTLALLGGQGGQRAAEILANRAAHAAVAHLNDLLFGVGHQNVVVDVFFAEFVFDDGDLLTMGFGQDTLEQGGFARTQKAGQYRGGNERHVCNPMVFCTGWKPGKQCRGCVKPW